MTLIALPRYGGPWALLDCGHIRTVPHRFTKAGDQCVCPTCYRAPGNPGVLIINYISTVVATGRLAW